MDSRKDSIALPSSSASASKPLTSSATSSPPTDSAARRSCSKCSRRMSSYTNDKHSICLNCRDVNCSVDVRCKECSSWSTEAMLEYVKHQQSLVSKGRKRSSVATPTSAPPSVSPSAATVQDSASPSQVVHPVSSVPSLTSEEGLKSLMYSVLASFLSQPTLSLGFNPFVAAPAAEVPNVSTIGSGGGGE